MSFVSLIGYCVLGYGAGSNDKIVVLFGMVIIGIEQIAKKISPEAVLYTEILVIGVLLILISVGIKNNKRTKEKKSE